MEVVLVGRRAEESLYEGNDWHQMRSVVRLHGVSEKPVVSLGVK